MLETQYPTQKISKRYAFTAIVFVLRVIGFYLGSDLSGGELSGELAKLNPLGLIMGFLFYFLAISISLLIFYRCLRYVGLKPPIKGVAKAWIFGSFLDNITPTIMPLGEASMAYFLEKFYKISYSKSLAAIGMYVSAWGMSVSMFSAVAVIVIQYFLGIPEGLIVPIVLVVLVFTAMTTGWLLLLTRKKFVERVVRKIAKIYNRIYNVIKRRKLTYEACVFMIEFEESYSKLEAVMKNKRHIFVSVLMFAIPQLCHVLCMYSILVFGFGVNMPFLGVLLIHIISSVAGLVSFVPSGLGVYEVVAGSSPAGTVPVSTAAAAVMLYRIIFVWTTNLLGGFIGVTQGIGSIKVKPVSGEVTLG